MKILIPKIYIKDIFSIDYDKLLKNDYKVIIFDLDNTIGNVHEDKCPVKAANLINSLTDKFTVCIVSNSHEERVHAFCEDLICDHFSMSVKPSLKSFRKIKKKYQIPYNKMVMIGDQIMTDIFVGNRIKLLTILVDPLREDLKITNFNRKLERFFMKRNNIKRGSYYEEKK